jgi:pterin-4a-carbinolamine dehydratase
MEGLDVAHAGAIHLRKDFHMKIDFTSMKNCLEFSQNAVHHPEIQRSAKAVDATKKQ